MKTVPKKITQNQADLLARLFNVTMNSALLYNASHPTTLKNTLSLHKELSGMLNQYGTVSFIVNRDSLFVEEWPVADAINPRRLIQQFIRIGIFSVTFYKGMSAEEFQFFISVSVDSGSSASASEIEKSLQNKKINSIRINYVRFGKVLSSGNTESSDLQRFSSSVKGNDEFPNKKQKLKDILFATVDDQRSTESALKLISDLKSEVQTAEPVTLNTMLDTLNEIRIAIAEAVETSKINGNYHGSADSVSLQLNELTSQTVLKLIKQEYGRGAISVKRLAQIICRLLPDLNELRRLLPGIKTLLIEEGMTLDDYLQLIKMLNVRIDSESLADSLGSAAEKIGISVNEIIDAFRKEPDDAAKLILLASEIRQGNQTDDIQLSNFLTGYIEKTCKALALQSEKIDGQGAETLRRILTQVEEQIVSKLDKCGVHSEILEQVKRRLTENFESVFDSAAKDWILSVCTGSTVENTVELFSRISGFFEQQSQLSRIQDALSDSLMSRGFNSDNIRNILSILTSKTDDQKQVIKLPSNALSANNMLFLLNREINQHKRYGTLFSTMVYTVENIKTGKVLEKINEEDKKILIPQLFQIVKKHLRETDLLGTIGVPEVHSLFSIMTLTGYEGAEKVRDRIRKSLEKKKINLKGIQVNIEVMISITVPQQKYIKDLRTYLNAVRLNHRTANAVFTEEKKEMKH
mgnify:FL=1